MRDITSVRLRPILRLLVLLCLCSGTGGSLWASLSNCPGQGVQGSETLDAINTGGGCQVNDKQFLSFTSTYGTPNIEMFQSTAGSEPGAPGNQITGLSAFFDGSGATQLSTSGNLDFFVAVDNSTEPNKPATGKVWTLDSLTLIPTDNNVQLADTVNVREDFCLNVSGPIGASSTFDQSACGAAGGTYGFINFNHTGGVTTTTNSAGNNSSTVTVSFANSLIFSVAIRDTISITRTGGSIATVSSVGNGLDEIAEVVPEPSMTKIFGMLAAIALVSYSGRRRRKLGPTAPMK